MDGRKRRRPDTSHNGFGHSFRKVARLSCSVSGVQVRNGFPRQGPSFSPAPPSFLDSLENRVDNRQESVLPFLMSHRDELGQILNGTDLRGPDVHCLIKGLKTAVEVASCKEEILPILQLVIQSSFLVRSLVCSIAVLNGSDGQIDRGVTDNVIAFLRHLTLAFPGRIRALISVPVDLLHAKLQRLQSVGCQFSWPMRKQLFDLQSAVNEAFPGAPSLAQGGLFSAEQPADFRALSIFPRSEDMLGLVNPTVRPNKIRGPYQSNLAYLDTHFRLLREDFVKPLREGLTACLAPRSHFVPACGQAGELQIYRKVQVLHPVCQWAGITYKVRFDAGVFRPGLWSASKRLMKGSLVCLMATDCDEIFFATVTRWDAQLLARGLVWLKFSVSHTELSKRVYRHKFVMVESPVFFESYQHVLTGLQEMDVQRVPFQRYIVKCKAKVHPPAYLQQRDVSLDLRPLLRNANGDDADGTVGEAEMESCPGDEVYPVEEPVLEQALVAEERVNMIEEQDHLTEDSFGPPEGSVSPAEKTMEAAAEEADPSGERMGPAVEYIHLADESDSSVEEEHLSASERSFSPAEEFISIAEQQLHPGEEIVSLTGRGTGPLEKSMNPIKQRGDLTGQGGDLTGQGGDLTGQGGDLTGQGGDLTGQGGDLTGQGGDLTGQGGDLTGHGDNLTGQGGNFAEKNNKYQVDPFKQDFRSLRWLRHFDKSQLKALQKALTREFALIQGPPGTGKTFLGLKIVQLLLHHQSLWQKNNVTTEHSPILVVCNTNHALDQFLEGMLEFKRTGIVRIGGFCNNEKLQKFSLVEIRQTTLQQVLTPSQRRRFKEIKEKIELTKAEISYCSKILEMLPTGILHEKELEPEMNPDVDGLGLTLTSLGETDGSVILKWLKVPHWLRPQNGIERRTSHREEEIDSGVGNSASSRYFSSSPAQTSTPTDVHSRYRADEDDGNDRDLDNDLCDSPCSAEQWAGEKFAFIIDSGKSDEEAEIRKCLAGQSIMREEEVRRIRNVWKISLTDRWRLYRKWKLAYEEKLKASINENLDLYEKMAQDLSSLILEEDLVILKKAVVIGMTTTGAAKYRALLQNIKPRIVIIEEAAEVLEAHVLTTLTPSCEHLIMIGDHKQLRPKPADYKMGAKYHLDVSLFERMIKNQIPFVQLSHQHRMRPEISQLLVPTFYSSLQDHRSVLLYEDIKGLATNIFFVQHQVEEDRGEGTLSHSNEYEARFLVGVCRHLLQQGYSERQVTALAPYTAQVLKIRAAFREGGMAQVSVKAVDDYQGEENDIVLLSLVRSNREGRVGFLKDKNRLCVAFSRAKMGFYCLGNFEALLQSAEGKLWEKIVRLLEERGLTGDGLPLVCPNHPDSPVVVKSPEDFQRGGLCALPCPARLACGHPCGLRCHPHDPGRGGRRCQEACGKVRCREGHGCPKRCWEECGPCDRTVEKVNPRCGHPQRVACSLPPGALPCSRPCERVLECGHRCLARCGQSCAESGCSAKCTEPLRCGHPCRGDCGSCIGGRLHLGCNRRCGRVLVCSHQCKEPCANSCQPCHRPCANRCEHGRCRRQCSEVCPPCQQPCPWRCGHHRCTRPCSQECDRPRCDQPCPRALPCGHPCAGLCGEACPALCRACHGPELTATFFGTEAETGARFVALEGCGHVLEVGGMDRLMDGEPGRARPVRLEVCPKCKTPIHRHTRYNAAIKRTWRSINRVKSLILGSSEEVQEKKTQLTESIIAASINLHYMEQRYDIRKKVQEARSLQQLAALESALGFFKFLDVVRKQAKACTLERWQSLELMLTRVDQWLGSRRVAFTPQQLGECRNEIARISYLADLMRLLSHWEAGNSGLTGSVTRAVDPLLKALDGKLTEDGEEEIKRELEEIRKLFPCGGLWISEDERLRVAEGLVMAKGDWYQCPNGHLYTVGECVRPAERSKCPECESMIGGEDHYPEGSNSQADEADSSSSSGSASNCLASERDGRGFEPPSDSSAIIQADTPSAGLREHCLSEEALGVGHSAPRACSAI
ncbi:NFX1-type zinc finger-containing protein 1-like [Heptranchias perlo]|uniref:NFX1-type zinc finger-containing protein 1-like n=1 Tax=Heptranchias perlo TaxID=212740 RepID=UPI00355A5F69